MGQAKRDIDAVVPDTEKTVYWTIPVGAAKTLELWEQHVHVSTASYAGTLMLPPVAEAQGLTYTITVNVGTNALTIVDQGDALHAVSIGSMDAAGDSQTLYSDGQYWQILAAHLA